MLMGDPIDLPLVSTYPGTLPSDGPEHGALLSSLPGQVALVMWLHSSGPQFYHVQHGRRMVTASQG